MKKSDFYFDLPEELIAQSPIRQRDHSKMLVLGRHSGKLEHKRFYDIVNYLNAGDCLVLNNSKVLPARLYGIKKDTGARVEFLLLNDRGNDIWECIVGPGKRAKEDATFIFGDGVLNGYIIKALENGNRLVKFTYDGNFLEILDKTGEMPLPHYIKERLEDKNRYQTVYAVHNGSAAAPTAGLHYTPELLDKIKNKGVNIAYITLHVGIGTFRPVKEENIENHIMHYENFIVSPEAAKTINDAKTKKGKIICTGTTCCRTLEHICDSEGYIKPCAGSTNLFIYPGYKFKCADSLITNFHLPESTLIMLVSAFCGRENILYAYKTAIKNQYRFFSFGDVMFITDDV